MDSRFAALADRYSQVEVEPEQNRCLPKFGTEFLRKFSNIDDMFNSLDCDYSDEQSTLEKQTIQNTALSGDTCW